MPSTSKQQQKFFGVVKSMQQGDTPKKGKAGKAAKSMSKDDVDDFASTKHKGLPKKVKREMKIRALIKKLVREIMSEGKLTEVSAGVNVWYFYKKANKDKKKFFKMLSDFRKKHSDTKWIKMLNYALDDFNENPKKYKTIDDKQNILFKNLQNNKKVREGKLKEDFKNNKWEVYVADEKGKEKIMKVAKSKRAGVILYNRLINTDKYHEVGMRVIKEGKLTEGKETIFDVAAKVVKDKQHQNYKSKKGKIMVDMQSANLLTQVSKKAKPQVIKFLSDLGHKNPNQLMRTLWALVK